jgi:hypothetical protein
MSNYSDYLTEQEAQNIDNLMPGLQNDRVGTKLRYSLMKDVGFRLEDKYYVDGLSWETAFKTIQKACNIARYQKNTSTIDSSVGHHKYIFIAPGQYNEQILFSGYNIHLIGLMYKLGNVDYGVVINKDEAITTTCVVGFTGAGIEIAGLQIHNAAAIPTLYIPTPGDGCWIHDNVLDGDDTNATYGIDWPDVRNAFIENNRIFNHVTAGMRLGSNGKWCRNSQIKWNHIAGSQGKGIYVPSGTICSAGYGSSIMHNTIVGTCTIGIHQESAGAYILVGDNWVQATTPVTDAGTGAADNHNAS